MTKLKLKNVTRYTIDWARHYIGFYDTVFLVGMALAFLLPQPFTAFFVGVLLYGLINAVVKNARPEITVVVHRDNDTDVESE